MTALFLAAALLLTSTSENTAETEHLRFYWEEGAIDAEGLSFLQELGERYYVAIRPYLDAVPEHKIVVLLQGPAQRPNGSWGTPHVDSIGRVHLFQYGPTHHDYTGAFAHELVHAMRIGRMPHHDWFFEEGFAEFVALRVEDERRGFPWYGYDVDLVAGQFLAADEGLDLAELRARHGELNMPCKLQSYALRGSFFDRLGREHGDAKLIEMARQKEAGSLDDYARLLGKSFEELVAAWQEQLRQTYAAREDAAQLAQAYRKQSPAQYQPICGADGKRR